MINRLFRFLAIPLWACLAVCVMAQSPPALEEHKMLKLDEGVWNANVTMWRCPGTDPIHSTAKETNTMLGELWSVGTMESSYGGEPYVGQAVLGYDPVLKKYVGTWIDNLTPGITHMQGDYDAKTKTLTLFYPVTREGGTTQERKNVMVYKDKNTREFTAFIKRGEEWVRFIEMLYERIE